ncbi:MAG TPA: hypothetical protein PL009_09415, partial [Flavipsychrobacter sp.]|nr:hypothetical protein [Flavipsychrobacter sp.]
MRCIFLLFLMVGSCFNVQAQFSDSVHHHVRLDATGIINTTNNGSSYLLNNAAQYRMVKKSV